MSERDEFEAWAKRQWPEAPLHRRPSGEYTAHTLEWRWEAWQAARAQQAVPDGWKLVPAEPTMGMVGAGNKFSYAGLIYKAMLAAAPQPSQEETK